MYVTLFFHYCSYHLLLLVVFVVLLLLLELVFVVIASCFCLLFPLQINGRMTRSTTLVVGKLQKLSSSTSTQ